VIASISTGVLLVKATCGGGQRLGSGFLVGTSVVMTAQHVVERCRNVAVHTSKGNWVRAIRSISWTDGGRKLDVATLKLASSLDDAYVFSLRTSQVPIGAYVSAVGHPLGEDVSAISGRVIGRAAGQHLVLRMLGAQGVSGGPIVDAVGDVVGLVNFAYGLPGALTGAAVSDNAFAYDLSSRWGGWRQTLCKTYRYGGIADC
jgi:S1-C subfamily serine protease